MRTILAWIIVIIEYGCMPILAGMLWYKKGKNVGVIRTYGYGSLTMLALFLPICAVMVIMKQTLSHMTYLWIGMNLIIVFLFLIKILCNRTIFLQELLSEKINWIVVTLTLIWAVIFTLYIPIGITDTTAEIVGIAVATNSMYQHEPYLIRLFENTPKFAYIPTEMIWAVNSKMTGLHPTVVANLLRPIIEIVFYICIGSLLSGYLLGKNERDKQNLFLITWTVLGIICANATVPVVLVWVSIGWLLLVQKGKINKRFVGLVVCLIVIATAFSLLGKMNIWIYPCGAIICYVASSCKEILLDTTNKKIDRYIVAYFIILVIVGMNLKLGYVDSWSLTLNHYKVSAATMQIADAIEKDETIGLKYIIAPDEITYQIQEYDVNIRVVPDLGIYYEGNNVYGLLVAMDNTGCSCLILPDDISDDNYMKDNGYRRLIACDGYVAYARV